MIIDTTLHTPEVKRKIVEKVGETFGFMERIRMGGIGSKRMRISAHSEQFTPFLSKQLDTHYCSIELRKSGILIHFKKYQTLYSWLVPSGTLQYENSDSFTFLANEHTLSVAKDRCFAENRNFLEKLFQEKIAL